MLVIGGTGFIGHRLVSAAKKKCWEVTSLSLNPPIVNRSIEGVHYISCDVNDILSVRRNLDEEFDYVVNLGGYIDHAMFSGGGDVVLQTHFLGLLNLLKNLSSRTLKRFVHVGSSDEYGNSPAPQCENQREIPTSAYSLGKVAGTHLLQMLNRTEEFPAVVLRLFLTYGPGQGSDRFLPQVIIGCLRGEIFPVSAGAQLRDFCFVEDTVDAIMGALTADDVEGKIFNIGSGKPISIRATVEMVTNLVGSGSPDFGALPYRSGESMSLYGDISRARRELDWRPTVTLENGLSKTIAWYRENS